VQEEKQKGGDVTMARIVVALKLASFGPGPQKKMGKKKNRGTPRRSKWGSSRETIEPEVWSNGTSPRKVEGKTGRKRAGGQGLKNEKLRWVRWCLGVLTERKTEPGADSWAERKKGQLRVISWTEMWGGGATAGLKKKARVRADEAKQKKKLARGSDPRTKGREGGMGGGNESQFGEGGGGEGSAGNQWGYPESS